MNLKNIKYISEELEKEYSTRQTYKIIILIIASSGQVHYDIFKHCWMEYMDKFPEVKCFFLYCDNTIDCDILVTHNSIIYNCEETYIPGILYKTIAAKHFCYERMSYEYVVRTNLSSFIHIPRLLEYVSLIENKNIACTNIEYFPFGLEDKDFDYNDECVGCVINKNKENWITYTKTLKSFFGYERLLEKNEKFFYLTGSFYIMSGDIIQKVLREALVFNCVHKENIDDLPDDIVISAIMQIDTIKPKIFKNTQKLSHKCYNLEHPGNIGNNIIHIRNRTDVFFENRNVDIMNMVSQVQYFYNPHFMKDNEVKEEEVKEEEVKENE
jgi:hypothetical protein